MEEIQETKKRREETLRMRLKRVDWAKYRWDNTGENTSSMAGSNKEGEDTRKGNREEEEDDHNTRYKAASRKDHNKNDGVDNGKTIENKVNYLLRKVAENPWADSRAGKNTAAEDS